MNKMKLFLIYIFTFLTFDMTAQTLQISEPVSIKMTLQKTREVSRLNKKPKLEFLKIDIDLDIQPQFEESFLFIWKVSDISEKYKGIPKEDRDEYEKVLEGTVLTYIVDKRGQITKFSDLKNLFRKIHVNAEGLFNDLLDVGMSPDDEEDFEELEDFLSDSFEEMYFEELLGFVKKYHDLFVVELPSENPSISKGKFEKEIAKEKLASQIEISYEKTGANSLEYREKQSLDTENSLYIFEKEEEAFRPFKKDYLFQLFQSGKILPSSDLTVTYNLKDGLIDHVIEKKFYQFSTTKYDKALTT